MAPLAVLISLSLAWANEHAAAPAAHSAAPESHAAESHASESHASESHAGDLAERTAPVSAREYKIPRRLLKQIESDYARETKKTEGVRHALLGLAVEFTQAATEGGAIEEPGRYLMQPGGGGLDLAGIVGTRRAAFNVRLVPRELTGAEIQPSRVYFVSRARARKLDGEVFGDGCGKVMDLTSAFRDRFAKRGFDVYSAERRYLSTLGGTFLFARFDQSALQVASVTFTDSRYPQLVCE